jgi:predicted O-methyltransferase YrrM
VIGSLRAWGRRITKITPFLLPVRGRHVEYSAIVSLDDDGARPSDRLLDLALRAASRARAVSMAGVVARMKQPPYYPDVWPGEHYKLLAALVLESRPATVIEIGTATGLSALAMLPHLPPGGRLRTFDIRAWHTFADTCLRTEDFADGSLAQIIGDVSDPAVFASHLELFRAADLIFVDGPKDGRFERILIERLSDAGLSRHPVVVLDDIRVWNMLAIWQEIRMPKLDLTSFGHWSGTGLVDWTDPAPLGRS